MSNVAQFKERLAGQEWWLWGSMLMAITMGCGQQHALVPVGGRVIIDGKPLTSGFVRFIPDEGRAASGAIGPDGRFKLSTYEDDDGALLGTHRVEIIAVENPTAQRVRYLTPVRYRDAATSGLVFEIKQPSPDLEIQLAWGGEQPVEQTLDYEGEAVPATPN